MNGVFSVHKAAQRKDIARPMEQKAVVIMVSKRIIDLFYHANAIYFHENS